MFSENWKLLNFGRLEYITALCQFNDRLELDLSYILSGSNLESLKFDVTALYLEARRWQAEHIKTKMVFTQQYIETLYK